MTGSVTELATLPPATPALPVNDTAETPVATPTTRLEVAPATSSSPEFLSISALTQVVPEWTRRYRFAVLGTVLTFAFGLAGLLPALGSERIAGDDLDLSQWSALNEFTEECWKRKSRGQKISEDCELALEAELKTPPHLDIHKVSGRSFLNGSLFGEGMALKNVSIWHSTACSKNSRILHLGACYFLVLLVFIQVTKRFAKESCASRERRKHENMMNARVAELHRSLFLSRIRTPAVVRDSKESYRWGLYRSAMQVLTSHVALLLPRSNNQGYTSWTYDQLEPVPVVFKLDPVYPTKSGMVQPEVARSESIATQSGRPPNSSDMIPRGVHLGLMTTHSRGFGPESAKPHTVHKSAEMITTNKPKSAFIIPEITITSEDNVTTTGFEIARLGWVIKRGKSTRD